MTKNLSVLILFISHIIFAQVLLAADGPGNTYELINNVLAPGHEAVETPDCAHNDYGRHIEEIWDAELKKYVFKFDVHIDSDNDRCIKFDRQRTEIKTYSASPDNLKGTNGETVTYKWKFKLPSNFKPSNNFTHIHQIKAVGGDDALPLFTLTPRKGSPNKLELIYTQDEVTDQDKKTIVDLADFENTWVEVVETIKIGEHGSYSIAIKKVIDNTILLSYTNTDIKTIRSENDFIRPKWGVYRSITDTANLKDESILFSDISIEEIPLKIFLKLDDIAVNNNSTPGAITLDYLKDNKIKASFGLVASRNDDSTLSVFSDYLNTTDDNNEKLFEIWHHGLDHTSPEFKGTTYAYQKDHFESANTIMKNLLGVQMNTFGAPFNHTDTTTNTVISENPNYKVTYFSSPAPDSSTGILNLNNRVNMENGTGIPDYDFFVENYNSKKGSYTDYMVLQGHPNVWDTAKLNEFKKIIDFLKAEGCEFELPYDYYLELNPQIPQPSSSQNITFPDIPNKTSDDLDFDPGATASSGLDVLYISSNTDIATIVDGKIHFKSGGSITITAYQPGNETFKPANYVSKTLTVTAAALEPIVASLPAYESFDYTIGTKIINDNQSVGVGSWVTSGPRTGDVVTVASPTWSSITGIDTPQGNAIQFQGSGLKPEFIFTPQTNSSDKTYTSFLMKVTDFSSLDTNPSRFIGLGKLTETNTIYGSTHIFVRMDASGEGYNLGYHTSNATSNTTWNSTVFNANQEIMIVLYHDNTNSTTDSKVWINPTIGDSEPTPTWTGGPRSVEIDRVQIYQHSNANTPNMVLDELRIGQTWTEATKLSSLLNTNNVETSKIYLYPNPVTSGGILSIDSSSLNEKRITISSLLGKIVCQKTTSSTSINVPELASGTYLINITQNNKTVTKKLIVKK